MKKKSQFLLSKSGKKIIFKKFVIFSAKIPNEKNVILRKMSQFLELKS